MDKGVGFVVGYLCILAGAFSMYGACWNIQSCNDRALATASHVRQIGPYHCLADVTFQAGATNFSSTIDLPCPIFGSSESGVVPICYAHLNPSNAALDRVFLDASPGSDYLYWKLALGLMIGGLVAVVGGAVMCVNNP